MDQPTPDWLCNEFFTQCLQKEINQHIAVTKFIISPAVPPGNNYGSYITRARVEYKNNPNDNVLLSTSLIVKAELTEGAIRELFSDFEPYEHLFYNKFIPKAKEFDALPFIPNTLFSPRKNVLILEDLKETGFMMTDRLKKLDFNHCQLYVTAAASLHAVSFAVFKHNPNITNLFNNHKMFSSDLKGHELFLAMIKHGMKHFADVTEKTERYKSYSQIIRDATPHLWEMLVEANKPSQGLNTLVQGDPWPTNMMFKYDETGKVVDIRLLDFQNVHYASPIHDLMSFIWGSANRDVKRERKFDEIYNLYFTTFNEKLKQLNCTEQLTHEQFISDIKKYSPLILFQAACTFPFSVDPDPVDFSIFLPKEDGDDSAVDNFYSKHYSENFCNNILPESLDCLEVAGVFEFLKCYKK